MPTTIKIARNGTYYINGQRVNISNLERAVRTLRDKGRNVSVTIAPHKRVANEHVVAVMDIAYRYGVEAVLIDY